jgi:HEAT repeat protein
MEPVYGGRVDTAVDLRCTCALGLVASNDPRAVLSLLELLHDAQYQARLGAIKALELVQPFHAEIVLRHKILQGDEEPEVIAQCFSSLVKAAAEESLAFIASFLDNDDDVLRESAALALGESRLDDALEILINASDELSSFDSLVQSFFHAIALQRKDRAYQYLLDKVGNASIGEAGHAIVALSLYNYNQDLKEQLSAIVRNRKNKKLNELVESHWKD